MFFKHRNLNVRFDENFEKKDIKILNMEIFQTVHLVKSLLIA